MYANNTTADIFSIVFSPQRENSNTSFASEKLENQNKIVNVVVNTRINNVGYELNTATKIDAHVEFASNPDRITRINNGITQKKLLSSRMIGI